MQTKLTNILQTQFNKTIEDCTNEELKLPLPILKTDIPLSNSSVSAFFSLSFVESSRTILER